MADAGDVSDGFALLFKKVVRVKNKDGESRSDLEVVFKILLKQEEDTLRSVRFQLSNDQELDFLYEVTYDENGFAELHRRQGLEIEFSDFPNVVRQQILTLVNQTTEGSEHHRFKAVLTSEDDKASDEDDGYDEEEAVAAAAEEESHPKKFFIIYQNLDHCRVQVFKFAFVPCDVIKTSQISQARYDELSGKLKALETEYKDLFKRVQRTSPKLLHTLKIDDDDQ
jgi:hypothetical protein